jgi:hypothetical protein
MAAGVAMLLLSATPALAHRLDEYLQATTISVGKDRVDAQIRLTPGVDVAPSVIAGIDTNADGVISDAEQRAYAERVLRDLSLAIDGTRVPLRLAAVKFASIADLKEGRGEIQIDFDAAVPRGDASRRLRFENHHQSRIAEYLVNALVPRDPDIHVTAQKRSYEQSSFQLDYAEAGVASGPRTLAWWMGFPGWLAAAVVLGLTQLALLARRRANVASVGATADAGSATAL